MDVTYKTLKDFYLVKPEPGLCAICGFNHHDNEPHNLGSMYYQYRFHQLHDRFPNWPDAVAHLSKDDQEYVKEIITELNKKWVDCDNPIAEAYKIQE